jgi:hypothetical protein
MAEKRRNFNEFFPKFQSLISRLLSRVSKKHENSLKRWAIRNSEKTADFLKVICVSPLDDKPVPVAQLGWGLKRGRE